MLTVNVSKWGEQYTCHSLTLRLSWKVLCHTSWSINFLFQFHSSLQSLRRCSQIRRQNVTRTTSNRAPRPPQPGLHCPHSSQQAGPLQSHQSDSLCSAYNILGISNLQLQTLPQPSGEQVPKANRQHGHGYHSSPPLQSQLHRHFTCLRAMTKHLTTIT